jgi:hypothetical protein
MPIVAKKSTSKALWGVTLCALMGALGELHAADADPTRFDGEWTTQLSCPNSNGALGYSFEFPSLIKNGVLHGEKGEPGKAGWLQIDGKIETNGAANLYAKGLVGAAQFAVGQRPAGTEYGYHLDVEFSDTSATGRRVEGRPCTVTFTRKRARAIVR